MSDLLRGVAAGNGTDLFAGAAVVCFSLGCGGLGWYRAAGDLPGVAPSDYAFYDFCGVSSQLYPASPSQIETSAVEALGDLGFRLEAPAARLPAGESTILAKTPDGRPAKITISPQNSLTNVKVEIGPIHLGDEELSRDFLRRIALNFGTTMRTYTPIDTTLPKRINPSRFMPEGKRTTLIELEGEGLRPNENRDKAAERGSCTTRPGVGAGLRSSRCASRVIAGRGRRAGPNFPFVPFPIPSNNQDAP